MRALIFPNVLAAILALSLNSPGQDIPRYAPKRPTISPYLNLLRGNEGPLPNYYSLVRPQLDQRSSDTRISHSSQSNDLAIRSLSSIVERTESGPTGTGSVFNNRSHFYPRSTTSPLRRR